MRVADFGLAVFAEARSARGSMRGGATAWLAPELFDEEVMDPRPTAPSDIYSFGCVIVEVGALPYTLYLMYSTNSTSYSPTKIHSTRAFQILGLYCMYLKVEDQTDQL